METKTKLGQEPAYPDKKLEVVERNGYRDVQEYKLTGSSGMTIRQKLGSDVLCALLSNSKLYENIGKWNLSFNVEGEAIVKSALSITDTFLKLESE